MPPATATDSIGIGLDDESWKQLSGAEIQSLLRILSQGAGEGRTYSSVSVVPPVDGRDLYVKPH